MQMNGYFDHAATTKPSQAALARYQEVARTYWGNPSAKYPEGQRAHTLLEEIRTSIATMLAILPNELIFTSGATEANDIIFQSLLWRLNPGEVIISGIEHSSVIQQQRLLEQRGWKVITLRAPNGFVQGEELAKALTPQTRLVSIMSLNNAVGTLQNMSILTQIVRQYEQTTQRPIHFHSDATQHLGKLPISLHEWDVDSASFSAHKFHGPRGVGFLYNRNQGVENLSRGGGQEGGLRGGTENLAGIAAMEVALKETLQNQAEAIQHVTELNTLLRNELAPPVTILTPKKNASPYIITVATPLPAEVAVRMLSDRGFSVSSGSACSSNARSKGERVLEVMDINPHDRSGAIRISFGLENSVEETRNLAQAINQIAKEM